MNRPIHFEIHAENTDRAIAFYTKAVRLEILTVGRAALLAGRRRARRERPASTAA